MLANILLTLRIPPVRKRNTAANMRCRNLEGGLFRTVTKVLITRTHNINHVVLRQIDKRRFFESLPNKYVINILHGIFILT